MNQVEIFFSVVQRKVVPPNDFTDLAQVGDRFRAFEDRYNATAQPFQRRFTTSDLDDLPARPGPTDIRPSADKKNPPAPWQLDQPPKDFQRRPLSLDPPTWSGSDLLTGF
ncbi:hypothetical protein OG520_35575 [Streptomyces sp. NBC_00984]|uniref:hypothetical protein n=1 Tax=Streptomyces sp. NBC_00984 TaxID=2903700 RepID=UPI00386651E1|nr:hypothetical protein OG520_35575 [Streptomyces sp. NBC_00984]